MKFPPWRRRREADLEEEIQSHLTMAANDRMQRGEAAERAKASARREFGSVGLVKEVTRAAWGWMWLEQLGQDLRYGVRMLFKNTGFTLIAAITLALGIGANTAIFSVVNSVLLRPLPYPDPDRLVMVYGINLQAPQEKLPLCVADFLDWKAQNQVFESLAGFSTNRFNYAGGETPQRIDGAWVTSDFFSTIGVKPAMGRAFLPEEDLPKTPQTVVVSDAFWRRYLDSDPNVIDRQIVLNARAFTVIGVMPPGFSFPEKDTELWAAERLAAPRRGPYYMSGLGRLSQGATLQRAQNELDVIARRVQDQ